jgi:ABC-type transport system substrate-binding protein
MGKNWGSVGHLILGVIILSLIGCMNKNREINAAFPLSNESEPLDPSNLGTADKYVLLDNLSIKLVHINSRNDYEYILAKDISKSRNGLSYRISIHKANFSDGTEITSDNIAASLKRMILKGSTHVPAKTIIKDAEKLTSLDDNISGIQILSPTEIEIHLNQPTKEFIYYLSLADSGVLHPSLAKKDLLFAEDWNLSSGAYTLNGRTLIENKKFLFYNSAMPSKVNLIKIPSKDSKNHLLNYDVGYSSFLDKSDESNINLPSPFRYVSGSYQYLIYIVLNTRRPIFSNLKTRQWLHRKISDLVVIPEANPFFKKANQFFLPDSFAFQKDFDPLTIIPRIDDTPKELNSSFTIKSKPTVSPYLFPALQKQLLSVLPGNLKIDFNDPPSEYHNRKLNRDFDAYLVGTSMSYNVVTESLNLLYRAKARFADNPNGRILSLIDEYQKTEGTTPALIEEIVKEMTLESEVIPLFYVSSPKFYNSDRIDISDMNTAESLTFWKLRVK